MDIKVRLRAKPYSMVSLYHEAAQEIERLEKTVLRLMSEVGRADQNLAIAVEALEMVMQHGRIDNSESRMNAVASAITQIKETK